MANGYIEVRSYSGDDLFTADVRDGETWRDTLKREYNKLKRTSGRSIALDTPFAGGGTHHIQMGYRLNRGSNEQTTLDSTIIVWVDPVAREHAGA
jgi:hypothetical protein